MVGGGGVGWAVEVQVLWRRCEFCGLGVSRAKRGVGLLAYGCVSPQNKRVLVYLPKGRGNNAARRMTRCAMWGYLTTGLQNKTPEIY